MTTISFVIPIYNEQEILSLLRKRMNQLESRLSFYKVEFIIVDDCSTDNTAQILDSWASERPNIHVLHLSRNFGPLIASRAGLSHCNGNCAYLMACDIQEPVELIEDMLKAWENGAEVVFCVPQNRVEAGLQGRLAELFHQFFHRFVHSAPSAYSFLLDREVLDALCGVREVHTNLVALVHWMGYKQEIITFVKRERSGGKSTWSFGRKLKLAIDSLVGFSYLPLRIMSYTGLLLSFCAVIYSVLIILSKVLYDIPIQGWASLMVVILLMFGVLFFFLGIIGEYLWRTLDETRSRPLYIVRKQTNFSTQRHTISGEEPSTLRKQKMEEL